MKQECLTKAVVLAEKGAFLFVTTAASDGYPHVAGCSATVGLGVMQEWRFEAWF